MMVVVRFATLNGRLLIVLDYTKLLGICVKKVEIALRVPSEKAQENLEGWALNLEPIDW